MKTPIWLGMIIGSTVGGLIPSLWGASMLSFSSILLSSIGAMVGIYGAFKLMR